MKCKSKDTFFFLFQADVTALKPFVFQGTDPWLALDVFKPFLPVWASIIIILTCLCFSALFSGLNLGLMSLDRTELKVSWFLVYFGRFLRTRGLTTFIDVSEVDEFRDFFVHVPRRY